MQFLQIFANTSLARKDSFVNGQWVAGKTEQTVTNPANHQTLSSVSLLEADEIHNAIQLAHRAYRDWQQQSLSLRQQVLQKWHDLIVENKEDLAKLMTLEQGKPISEARGEIDYAASFITWFAEQAKRLNGEVIASHLPDNTLSTRVEPVGVAALVTPWNFPAAMITRKAAAAMAAGCSVVVKPATETPLSALALAQLAKQAGIPDGVFNVVLTKGEVMTDCVANNPLVRSLSFTGSTAVGKIMLHACADTVKKSAMELGGNAPLIVAASANVATAVDIALDAKFATSGQDCLAANRLFIHRQHYATFIEQFVAKVKALKAGEGIQESTQIGPLMTEKAKLNTQAVVKDAIDKGATLHCGGDDEGLGYNFFMPTVLSDVTDEMRIYQEENFAPIAGLCVFDTLDEVIEKANDTEYGLAAYIIANDVQSIQYLQQRLDYGMIAVNTVKMTGPPIPFGGVKQSGLGREGGVQGFEPFTETKYICLSHS